MDVVIFHLNYGCEKVPRPKGRIYIGSENKAQKRIFTSMNEEVTITGGW
jgi:hypothetical protein